MFANILQLISQSTVTSKEETICFPMVPTSDITVFSITVLGFLKINKWNSIDFWLKPTVYRLNWSILTDCFLSRLLEIYSWMYTLSKHQQSFDYDTDVFRVGCKRTLLIVKNYYFSTNVFFKRITDLKYRCKKLFRKYQLKVNDHIYNNVQGYLSYVIMPCLLCVLLYSHGRDDF